MNRKGYIPKILLSLLCLLSFTIAEAQVVITTPDTLICPNTSATLRANLTGRNGVQVSLSDDYFTGVIPIGFSFSFYGNSYSKCTFSSNGYISFDTTRANQSSAWVISTGIPGNSDVYNCIMGHYADIYPTPPGVAPGTLDYCTVGTAPNRIFVLSFCDAPMYSCTSVRTSFQIILHETTNKIDIHLGNKPLCTSWNSGAGIEGVQNATGSDAVPVPGRNYPGTWTAFHSSHQFTPSTLSSGAATYTVAPITYAPVPNGNAPINWYTLAGTLVGTGDTVVVSPTVTTTYVALVTSCSDTLTDTVTVTVGPTGPGGIGPHIDSVNFVNPTYCGNNDGYIRVYGLSPSTPHTVYYTKDGTAVTPYTLTSNAQGIITINNLTAGVYNDIKVKRGICISNAMGPLTLVDPPLNAAFDYVIHYGCTSDTIVFTNQSNGGGPSYKYVWSFGDGSQDTVANPSHVYMQQALYNVTLVASNLICADTQTKSIDIRHPLIASFTVSKDSVCQQSQSITFTSTSTATGPHQTWDFGDGSAADTNLTAQHNYQHAGVYTVALYVSDFVPCQDTAYHTIVVDSIPYVNFTTSDSALCIGQGITFIPDVLTIGNTGLRWDFGDGTVTPNANPANHAYDSARTYTVKLTSFYRICPDTSITKDVVIKPFPRIYLGPDTVMCPNAAPLVIYDRQNAIDPAATWLWNTGETTNHITVNQPGQYAATVSLNGCSTSDSVEVRKDCYIDIPNSFTPNNDGNNDYFFPRQLLSRSVTTFHLVIYNRWGQTIFETSSIDGRGWDGKFNDKDQPEGVYVYLIDVLFANGVKEHYQGNVTLLR